MSRYKKVGEKEKNAFRQEVEQPYQAVGKDIAKPIHHLSQIADAFQFVQIQDADFSTVNGDYTLLGKG